MTKHANPPTHCDLCGSKIQQVFFDFRTSTGQWANGCPSCFISENGKLGLGRGQRYALSLAEEDRGKRVFLNKVG